MNLLVVRKEQLYAFNYRLLTIGKYRVTNYLAEKSIETYVSVLGCQVHLATCIIEHCDM